MEFVIFLIGFIIGMASTVAAVITTDKQAEARLKRIRDKKESSRVQLLVDYMQQAVEQNAESREEGDLDPVIADAYALAVKHMLEYAAIIWRNIWEED